MNTVTFTRPRLEPDSGICELPLPNGEAAILNKSDYLWARQFNCLLLLGYVVAVTDIGERFSLHRFLAGAGDGERVRFRNGNQLDLRRRNLEIVEPNPVTNPPKFIPDSGTARIRTNDGRTFLVDYCYYDWASQWAWSWDGSNVHCGSTRLHRLVSGADAGQRVTFINGDKLDCRRENLKINITSGIRGVGWYRPKCKWQAMLYLDGKNHHAGFYDCPLEAAAAYDALARRLLGDAAIINGLTELTPEQIERLELCKA